MSSTSPCLCIAIYNLFPSLLYSSHRAVCLLCDFSFSSLMPGWLSSLQMLHVSSAMPSRDSLYSSMCLLLVIQAVLCILCSCSLASPVVAVVPNSAPVTLFLFVVLVLRQPHLRAKYLSLSREQVALSGWLIVASWDGRR